MAGTAGPPLILYHTLCEHQLTPAMVCAHCGEAIDIRQVHYEPGPGATKVSEERQKGEERLLSEE